MSWNKINLVTKKDKTGMYDEYKCDECGFKQKIYGLNRTARCPKCSKNKDVYGCWSVRNDCVCDHCKRLFVVCPRKGHPNSKYWDLQRTEDEKLWVCPHGCLEDGSGIDKNARLRYRRKGSIR